MSQIKISIIFLVIAAIIWLFASWFAVRNLEEPQYNVVSKNKDYEIRAYESYIVAETIVSGPYDQALSQGFRNIADYIFGNNTKSEKIAMTVPVTESETENKNYEKIAMTVPVINKGNEKERTISFVMPSKYTLEDIPKPNTKLVILREVSENKHAVLKYSWYTNEKKINNKAEMLMGALKKDEVETIGEFSSARYNPPFSIPFLLRNEILIEVTL